MRVGQTIKDHFVLVKKLGSGSFGHLFEAIDERTNDSVAVKFMIPRTFESDSCFNGFVDDLEDEGALLAELRNVDGIPNLVDQGVDSDGTKFLVMDKVDGVTLKAYAASGNSPMDVVLAASIVGQLCEVLSGIHRHGYVHRDVKPENIMIDKSGDVHLVDVGAARAIGEPGSPAGTNRYAAPEQVRDQLPVAANADVFPLGCMLAELTTLTLPYPENYLLLEHRGSPPPEPSLARLAPDLVPIVSSMAAWDSELRPQDGAAAFQVLEPLLPTRGSPRNPKVHGSDPTARYRITPTSPIES